MKQIEVKSEDLQIGDVISPKESTFPFDTRIVRQIKDGMITFFRPYGTTADFSYTGGVICYTGIEEWQVSQEDNREIFILWARQSLK